MGLEEHLLADLPFLFEDLLEGGLQEVGGCVVFSCALSAARVNLCHHLQRHKFFVTRISSI
jgi:hypothetical protein